MGIVKACTSLLLASTLVMEPDKPAYMETAMYPAQSRVGEIFAKTKTVCVGRYLLEVPRTATVVYGPANAPFPIERYPEQAARLLDFAQEFAKDALAKKSKFPIGPASSPGSLVGTIKQGNNNQHKIVYGVDKGTGAFYTLHSIFVLGPDLYVQEHSHFGSPQDLESIEGDLKSYAARTIPRLAEATLEKSGLCIDGAFVVDAGDIRYERTTLGIRLNEFDDVHFALEMILKDRLIDSDALEPRLHEAEENAKNLGYGEWYSRIKFFRRGKRIISNWHGFEALAKRPPQKNISSVHEFAFVSQGEPGNPLMPVLTLDLYTGVKGNTFGEGAPSLSDDEMIELWDKLTNSIRPIAYPVKE
jgi:hypothetical protein